MLVIRIHNQQYFYGSIYKRERERERERVSDDFTEHVAFVYFQPNLLLRYQQGNNKYYTTVSRATAGTASFLVVEHKGSVS